ncbi:MAG: hypothetical protein WKG06_38705 [Segetibacter sp.]
MNHLLDEIVETLGYKINVGGTGLVLGTGTTAIGDEVLGAFISEGRRRTSYY